MACRLIAFRQGSVPELMAEGVTGFIVDGIDGAIAALERIGQFGRGGCRRHFEQYFSAECMAQGYVDLYHSLIASTGAAVDDRRPPMRAPELIPDRTIGRTSERSPEPCPMAPRHRSIIARRPWSPLHAASIGGEWLGNERRPDDWSGRDG